MCAALVKRQSVLMGAVLAKKTPYRSRPPPYGREAEGRFVQLIGRPGLPLLSISLLSFR